MRCVIFLERLIVQSKQISIRILLKSKKSEKGKNEKKKTKKGKCKIQMKKGEKENNQNSEYQKRYNRNNKNKYFCCFLNYHCILYGHKNLEGENTKRENKNQTVERYKKRNQQCSVPANNTPEK